MAGRRAHGEGAIYHDATRDRWVGEIRLSADPLTGKTRRKRVTGKTRKEVAERLDTIRSDARAGIGLTAVPTVVDLYSPWIDRRSERVTPATAKMYRDLWSAHVGPMFAGRPVDQITVAEVEGFLTARRHLTTATLRKIRGLLAQILDEAVRHRAVGFNAARLAHLPAGTAPARESRALAPDEARSLIDAADGERHHAWLVLALHTGARPGELARLEWSDLDLDAGTVRIYATKTKAHRTVRLAPSIVAALSAHRSRLAQERLIMGGRWPVSDLVFVSEKGTPIDTANLRRFLARIAKAAGLEWSPTPYTMRHSHASILSDSGLPVEALAQRLGHRDSRTTSRHYLHPVTPVVEHGGDFDLLAERG